MVARAESTASVTYFFVADHSLDRTGLRDAQGASICLTSPISLGEASPRRRRRRRG